MNKGIKLSSGEWFYFLGTDDCLLDEKVLEKVALSFDNLNTEILFGSVSYEVVKFKPFIYNKNKTEKTPLWNWKIWIYNTVHHQATFYRKKIFDVSVFELKYQFLSDYAMNIRLYKERKVYEIIDVIVAKCISSGVSKTGAWQLYKEEIELKKTATSTLLLPFFYVIALIKFTVRQIQNGIQ